MESVSTKAWEKDGQEEGKAAIEMVWEKIEPQSAVTCIDQNYTEKADHGVHGCWGHGTSLHQASWI